MMKFIKITILNGIVLTIFLLISCFQSVKKNPDEWGAQDAQKWFTQGDWKQGWAIIADESVDSLEFEKYYAKNPERWEKAFHFLSTTDLKNIEPGKYELERDSLFAKVELYQTKDENNTRFESHRRYADIQYLISGKEYIGVVSLSKMQKVTVPYNSEKDITFYCSAERNYRLADNSRFFIFFPDDAHCPCRKVDNNEAVKKIVMKVALD
ncbi:YhcH/YjgK/YiaL family protein [Sunxiuqinia elliptica]|uniref:YhcH/YjgK/YiaL family protein n=1 Tax=Sunxiuqinia elliptica TaxID=655355 RepID=A0A4R6HC59_9BACT|nr:YhcH/YjgK/YiaL family protein [Sunxiuqinia elliptica]TDO05361.1 YhcH/YjgK/YiaL family protein [Sunxiuqinia elliptica]TDO64908.1 YhcH/YjgK/YiaL family protein [Sunxiuqinia elliptica]